MSQREPVVKLEAMTSMLEALHAESKQMKVQLTNLDVELKQQIATLVNEVWATRVTIDVLLVCN